MRALYFVLDYANRFMVSFSLSTYLTALLTPIEVPPLSVRSRTEGSRGPGMKVADFLQQLGPALLVRESERCYSVPLIRRRSLAQRLTKRSSITMRFSKCVSVRYQHRQQIEMLRNTSVPRVPMRCFQHHFQDRKARRMGWLFLSPFHSM